MRTEAGEKRPVARLAEIHGRAGCDAAKQVGQVAPRPVMKTNRFPEHDVEHLANEYEACGVVQLW